MREDRSNERAALIDACLKDERDEEAMELVRGYVREGMRLNPQFAGLFRIATEDDEIPQGGGSPPLVVQKGDWVFASYKNAHLNVRSPRLPPLTFAMH